MGGFGSGGHRTGAGRKKKPTHLRGIDGGAGHRGPADGSGDEPPRDDDAPAIMPAPADLSPEELAVWQEWAPLANAERTLLPSTLANFVLLCQAEVDRRELRRRYTRVRTWPNGELLPLVVIDHEEELSLRREHRTLLKDIHSRMKDFKLAPFGKEILAPGAAGHGEEDPMDAFDRKRG